MTRHPQFASPFLLGFEHIERLIDRAAKNSEGYPPYNVEHTGPETLRITLAVAGFAPEDLSVTVDDDQLVIRGSKTESDEKQFLHRGIAARQFLRTFVLADGMEVTGAHLDHGLLAVELDRPKRANLIKTVPIRSDGIQPTKDRLAHSNADKVAKVGGQNERH